MIVGICKLDIHILSAPCNLKEKRRIVKKIKDKIKSLFEVSIAEIGNHELWHRTTLGIACVSNEKKIDEEIIYKIKHYIEKQAEVEIIESFTEFIPF